METNIYHGETGILKQELSTPLYRSLDSLSQYSKAMIVFPLITVFVVHTFAQFYRDMPWILWQHIFTDFCLFISLPLYITFLGNVFGDILDYCRYEKKNLTCYDIRKMKNAADAYLEVWEECKYYPYVSKKDIRYIHCTDGFTSPRSLLQNGEVVRENNVKAAEVEDAKANNVEAAQVKTAQENNVEAAQVKTAQENNVEAAQVKTAQENNVEATQVKTAQENNVEATQVKTAQENNVEATQVKTAQENNVEATQVKTAQENNVEATS